MGERWGVGTQFPSSGCFIDPKLKRVGVKSMFLPPFSPQKIPGSFSCGATALQPTRPPVPPSQAYFHHSKMHYSHTTCTPTHAHIGAECISCLSNSILDDVYACLLSQDKQFVYHVLINTMLTNTPVENPGRSHVMLME